MIIHTKCGSRHKWKSRTLLCAAYLTFLFPPLCYSLGFILIVRQWLLLANLCPLFRFYPSWKYTPTPFTWTVVCMAFYSLNDMYKYFDHFLLNLIAYSITKRSVQEKHRKFSKLVFLTATLSWKRCLANSVKIIEPIVHRDIVSTIFMLKTNKEKYNKMVFLFFF